MEHTQRQGNTKALPNRWHSKMEPSTGTDDGSTSFNSDWPAITSRNSAYRLFGASVIAVSRTRAIPAIPLASGCKGYAPGDGMIGETQRMLRPVQTLWAALGAAILT